MMDRVVLILIVACCLFMKYGEAESGTKQHGHSQWISVTNATNTTHGVDEVHVGTPRHDDHAFLNNSAAGRTDSKQNYPVDAIRQESKRDKGNRRRRKIISRAGHYLLRSKGDSGSLWGSQARGRYDDDVDYAYSRRTRRRDGYDSTRNRKRDRDLLYYAALRHDDGYGRGNSRYGSRMSYDYNYPMSRRGSHRTGSSSGRKNYRKTISQKLKMEIGQYALMRGAKEAADKYESRVGRRLKERIIEKFARRYRVKQDRQTDRPKEAARERYNDRRY